MPEEGDPVGTVHYATAVRPLLGDRKPGEQNQTAAVESIAGSIGDASLRFSQQDEDAADWLRDYSVLAADFLATHYSDAGSRCVEKSVESAVSILSSYLLGQLRELTSQQPINRTTIQKIASGLEALCGQEGLDSVVRNDIRKSLVQRQLPAWVKQDAETPDSELARTPDSPGYGGSIVRPQTDLTAAILDHIAHPNHSRQQQQAGGRGWLQLLRRQGAASIIIDTVHSLPHLANYIHRWQDTILEGSRPLPLSEEEAASLRAQLPELAVELTTARTLLQLPIFCNADFERFQRLSIACLGGLLAALSAAAALVTSGGDNVYTEELPAKQIVEGSIGLASWLIQAGRSSTRLGAATAANLATSCAWVLFTGIEAGFGVNESAGYCHHLSLPLIRFGLSLLTDMLAELGEEEQQQQQQLFPSSRPEQQQLEPASFNLGTSFTCLQRLALIYSSVPIYTLLMRVARAAFERAVRIMSASADPLPPTSSRPVANSSCAPVATAEESEEDDGEEPEEEEEEPLLGRWMQHMLRPASAAAATANSNSISRSDSTEQQKVTERSRLPVEQHEGEEPHAYLLLASLILNWLAGQLADTTTLTDAEPAASWLTNYLTATLFTAPPVFVDLVGGLIKVMDDERLAYKPGAKLLHSNVWIEFSASLTSLTRSLMVGPLSASGQLTSRLLASLGLDPEGREEEEQPWPLTVPPRRLAILAQVLMARQVADTDTYSTRVTGLYIRLWERTVRGLMAAADRETGDFKEENMDINVEHVQLLLMLFHALQLLQKKQVLLHTANQLIALSSSKLLSVQHMLMLARLALLVDYIIRHLYEPPSALLDHIQTNLFQHQQWSGSSNGSRRPAYFPSPDHPEEEEWGDDATPRYYLLSPLASGSSMEVPKLDGLAVSFLLTSPEALDYVQLYEALVNCLETVNTICGRGSGRRRRTVSYSFAILWRLLHSLPPPAPFLAKLVMTAATASDSSDASSCERPQQLSFGLSLHTLVLGQRSANKAFSTWIREGLAKQGLLLGKAEALVKAVGTDVNAITFEMRQLQSCLTDVEEKLQKAPAAASLQMSDLLLLDCLIAKFQISLDKIFVTSSKLSSSPGLEGLVGFSDLMSLKAAEWAGGGGVGSLAQAVEAAQQLVPGVARLVGQLSQACRAALLQRYQEAEGVGPGAATLMHSLCLAGTRCQATSGLAVHLADELPKGLRSCLEEWQLAPITAFPPASAWKSQQFDKDIIPGESFLVAVVMAHAGLTEEGVRLPASSLKHLLFSATRFACELLVWCSDSGPQRERLVSALLPLLLDSTTESLAELVALALERYVGTVDSDKCLAAVYQLVLEHSYPILMDAASAATPTDTHQPTMPQEIIRFMETMLDKEVGRIALRSFFSSHTAGGPNIAEILLSLASPNLPSSYTLGVLRLFDKLLSLGDKQLEDLCGQLGGLRTVPSARLEAWLRRLVVGSSQPAQFTSPAQERQVTETRLMLQNFAAHIVVEWCGVPEEVPLLILSQLIPIATEMRASSAGPAAGFPDLLSVMIGLASAGNGKGHVSLFRAALEWLELVKRYTLQKNVLEKLEQGVQSGRHMLVLENASHLLSYVSSVVLALKYGAGRWGLPSPSDVAAAAVSTATADDDMSWTDDVLDDDDCGSIGGDGAASDDENGGGVGIDDEEDEEEEALEDKLCTYTQTARVYMNQHWYHCHTCGMVDRDGCCSVCARVCHRDHDVTYSKHGSFFCDCGAREGGSCLAMTPRVPLAHEDSGMAAANARRLRTAIRGSTSDPAVPEALMQNNNGGGSISRHEGRRPSDCESAALVELARKVEPHSQQLRQVLAESGGGCMATLLEIAEALAPVLESSACRGAVASPLGATLRIRTALQALHTAVKAFEMSETLVLPTLGSQEGAFENVKMNFSGEQGQTIRQLLSAHMIRRGIMCCLSAPGGRRQHLAVSHEKGKITVLQLSALLRQADTSQKKLTLTRLASAPVPFTVLSLVSNPANENFLAVCGLKECRVLTFNAATGGVSEQLVLQLQLEAVNYIVRPLWLPGSQTQLAVVTADMVKIYDLATDALSPTYYFLIPSGKIRDAAFVHTAAGEMVLLLMSSAGHIYFQLLCEDSSARNGSFYVTNILDIDHPEVVDYNGSLCGGGVSIYFSHSLQMLFFSYAQGKSFMATVAGLLTDEKLTNVFQLQFKASSNMATVTTGGAVATAVASGKNSNNSGQQPLCGWSEVAGHPGLVTAVLQQSGNPLIIMVEPERCTMQEIKIGTKSKIMDMVAIRHVAAAAGGGEEKTTLILLCEDGSLKIYMADPEATGYWLRPQLRSSSSGLWSMMAAGAVRQVKRKKAVGKATGGCSSGGSGGGRSAGSHPAFSTDFFEHCQPQVADIEFGGSDVLQIYNVGQIKQRLQTGGLYIANTKPSGFQLEITNNDPNTVVVAIRVLVGSQDLSRVPASLQLFGRSLHIGNLSHARWFEFPLTREESIQCQGRLIVNFGPSLDPEGVNMIDSVQVWTKTKEAFGWPEDNEEFAGTAASHQQQGATAAGGFETAGEETASGGLNITELDLSLVDRVAATTLETMEGLLALEATGGFTDGGASPSLVSSHHATNLQQIATRLLVAAWPPPVTKAAKSVLYAVHPSRTACHLQIDAALLEHAAAPLLQQDLQQLEVEQFHHLIGAARSVARARPRNLVRFARQLEQEGSIENETMTNSGGCQRFVQLLVTAFWNLLAEIPANCASQPLGQPGLTHVEVTVQYMVDILHALTMADIEHMAVFTAGHYIKLLLCPDQRVAFSARAAIVRAVRPKSKKRRGPAVIQAGIGLHKDTMVEVLPPERPSAPAPPIRSSVAGSRRQQQQQQLHQEQESLMDYEEGEDEEGAPPHHDLNHGPGGVHLGGVAGNLEALLPLGGMPAAMLDLPADEAMVELAIALSLQDQDDVEAGALAQGLQGLQQLANLGQGLAGILGAGGGAGLNHPEDSDGEEDVVEVDEDVEEEEDEEGEEEDEDRANNHRAVRGSRDRSNDGGDSDSTASAPGSDEDERHPSSVQPVDEGGPRSDSCGSLDDVIGGGHHHRPGGSSGRQSSNANRLAYSFGRTENLETGGQANKHEVEGTSCAGRDQDEEGAAVLAEIQLAAGLRQVLLEQLVSSLGGLREVGGRCTIPYMQLVLALTVNLDPEDDRDAAALRSLLATLLRELGIAGLEQATENGYDHQDYAERSKQREFQLIILRLLSVLMSRSSSRSGQAAADTAVENFVTRTAATTLAEHGMHSQCLVLLKSLLPYWKSQSGATAAATNDLDDTTTTETPSLLQGSHQLLKPAPPTPLPDMAPFFLKQYVKTHAADIFEAYPQLLTEMALRLPYQMKKIVDSGSEGSTAAPYFEPDWLFQLCELLATPQAPFVKRQVRKLLLLICGSRDQYRQLRDMHTLETKIREIKITTAKGGFDFSETAGGSSINLQYETLIQLIEQLKTCVEVAESRTLNWQKFCLSEETVLPFLLQISFLLENGVAAFILQLLQAALCPPQPKDKARSSKSGSPVKSVRKEKSRSEEPEDALEGSHCASDEKLCIALARQVSQAVKGEPGQVMQCSVLARFLEKFLLECNTTAVRWQAHSLIVALHSYSSMADKEMLVSTLWALWTKLPNHGRRSAQFVDLLGYFSVIDRPATSLLSTSATSSHMGDYATRAVAMLRDQNRILATHANSALYSALAQLVDFSGFFLESDPCLVCNNPEVPFVTMKLANLKVDTKYTTSTQLVKLSGSHSISRIGLRIGDLKRQKMVRTININYNNRSVAAVVDLKNRSTVWHLAKRISLTAGQTDIRVDFPLPIVACNIMIEYLDFYENIQAVGESLQCPRCSATVPANPGVCSNCGENVFQCHKCRTINYDEKDPFLCNSCGFCKYAKFEYSLTARPCCAVDPIEKEEDRNKALTTINTLLEKADKVYRQLIANKPELEELVWNVQDGWESCEASAPGQAISPINKYIHQLGQKYCLECKSLFEELSSLIQKVMATRLELLAFDRAASGAGQNTPAATPQVERKLSTTMLEVPSSGVGGSWARANSARCYGCASACVEHCLTLLKALASRRTARAHLLQQGLVPELLNHNLRRGTAATRSSVQGLICLLTRNNTGATEHLNSLLYTKIKTALASGSDQNLAGSVRHEMTLLAAIVRQQDACWESRLRTVVRLFIEAARRGNSPAIMDAIILPCLNILQEVSTATGARTKADKSAATPLDGPSAVLDIRGWLAGRIDFRAWSEQLAVASSQRALVRKYFTRWRSLGEERAWRRANASLDTQILGGDAADSYLKQILFNPSSKAAREVVAALVQSIMEGGPHGRRVALMDTLTSFLDEVGQAGEASAEFMALYRKLVASGDWHYYLAVKGVLIRLAGLIEVEIAYFGHLEETRLGSDLALGFAVKQLTGLLASLLEEGRLKVAYKSRLVSAVLAGYLSLRRLVIQRTKMVDETQESLLALLEDLTTGTEEETRAFMRCCIETLARYPPDDHLTPVFIFERLCSLIYPEEADTGEFFLALEKDPQQEEFLQGRMLGNPYSSREPGLGPLMREIKNKICMDCELVALLEDDNGMELLVNNKIISLDLPVKEVYQRIWLPEAGESEPMRVVYRMRGLLGDATEEFIERLDKKEREASDDEMTYGLASVLGECGGLKIMLDKLAGITSLAVSKPMMAVLLKLFGYCVKLGSNRQLLLRPELGTIPVLLNTLKLCLAAGETHTATGAGQPSLTETLLELMERLLVEAASTLHTLADYQASTSATAKDISSLVEHAVQMRPGTHLHHRLLRVLPFLTYANRDNMELVINHFTHVLDFNKFDQGHTSEDEARLEAWVALCDGIERNQLGNTMKEEIVRLGLVKRCTDYIKTNAPANKEVLLKTDSPAWKEFSMKPSIKFILRGLVGLAAGHPQTQMALADSVIGELHLLEQMSSDEHLGSLAEAVLEAVKGHPEAAKRVDQVRTATREEKKKLAMAMRAKQLKSIGLKANEKGQVKAESSLLQQFQAIGEESGLSCVICREGYRFQPGKVLAIYTFTRRCQLEEAEKGARKTMGFSTVSHFNLVHVDCHLAAVRQARARDEWESALLQNANTRCNGLLPLWGPSVPESVYAACLARHNTYLAEVTGQRDIGYQATVHDMKLLVLKFAQERSFSVDSGGGGPQSNLHLLPYLVHMALYVINTTRAGGRELRQLEAWLDCPPSLWEEQATAVDGPYYQATLAIIILPPQEWLNRRVQLLQRLLLTAHLRAGCPVGEVAEYAVYRQATLFFALLDHIARDMWAGVALRPDQDWASSLAEWIRNNDELLMSRSTSILQIFQEDLLPAQDMSEVMDVCGLLPEIPSPASAILEVLSLLP